jgi:hypothetical protein
MAEPIPSVGELRERQGSAAAIEIQDSSGRRRTVQLEELSAADRELAEKFGYKPVRLSHQPPNATSC